MKYKYIDDVERDFPTLGIRANKGDIIETDIEINSPFVRKIEEKKGADE